MNAIEWSVSRLFACCICCVFQYGWGRSSEQQLLQPIMAELEPAAQAYFTEELEERATVYSFDGYEATIKQVRMTEVGDEGADPRLSS